MIKNTTEIDPPVQVITFGCRLNAYESEVIKKHATTAGINNTVIINTCAVTQEAERQALQTIRKINRTSPEKKIIVTGCSAQIDPKKYKNLPGITHILGNQEKMDPGSYFFTEKRQTLVNNIMSVQETAHHLISGFEGKTRAFLQVQNGCNHRCTFCTIPYGRGNSRSVPISAIVEQTKLFMQQGYKEIVLTGVDMTAYGQDLPGQPTLGQMMRRLLAHVPNLPRLRLSSVDPVEIDEEVFHLLAQEPRFMPHLHISLQAGDNMILKRMKRRHLREDLIKFCEKARAARSDVVFGADIIAGFPTETETMFENTRTIISKCQLTYLHVFPYSVRPGTPAAKMPQVPRSTIKERAKILRTESGKALSHFLSKWVGHTVNILIEKENIGRTEHFAPVKLCTPYQHIGDIIPVKITGRQDQYLIGTYNV